MARFEDLTDAELAPLRALWKLMSTVDQMTFTAEAITTMSDMAMDWDDPAQVGRLVASGIKGGVENWDRGPEHGRRTIAALLARLDALRTPRAV